MLRLLLGLGLTLGLTLRLTLGLGLGIWLRVSNKHGNLPSSFRLFAALNSAGLSREL